MSYHLNNHAVAPYAALALVAYVSKRGHPREPELEPGWRGELIIDIGGAGGPRGQNCSGCADSAAGMALRSYEGGQTRYFDFHHWNVLCYSFRSRIDDHKAGQRGSRLYSP